ncbi:MAG: DUF2812 domain-containing protein [Oscillospiraceae bacterium]|nr:DUF2812 domain-containing protein [Oscillospiraceae bacterium]
MRKTKHCIAQFTFYDRTGIQEFLEKQARKGWVLERLGNFTWKFRRGEPKELHYAVTYFPKASIFDPGPSAGQEQLREFCAHAGWELVGTTAQMQIFRSTEEDPVPIETDPELELENIHKSVKKGVFPGYFLLLAVCVLNLIRSFWQLWESPLEMLSSNLTLFTGFSQIILFLICALEIGGYFLWRRAARKALETGGSFVRTWGFRKAELGLLWVEVAALAVVLASVGGKTVAMYLCGVVLLVVVMAAVIGIREGLKRLQFSARDNKIITLISCVVLSVVICGVGTVAVFKGIDNLWPEENVSTYEYRGHTFTSYKDTLPLTVAELTGIESEDYSNYIREDRSFLVEKYVARQDAHVGDSELPDLRYVIVDVKLPWLYDTCLNALREQYTGWEYTDVYGNVYHDEFVEVDAAPWDADRVYQGYSGEYPETEYILCYGDRIINIEFDWEPTAEQMRIVREKLV